jgi:hypothetical protein
MSSFRLDHRDARSFRWLAGWSMDLKLGARMLIKCARKQNSCFYGSRACVSAKRQNTGHQTTSLNRQIQPNVHGSAPVEAL